MNNIEKAIELLKIINKNMKVDHMMKDMWGGATEEETREYTEDFGLINLAISALEKQIPYTPTKCTVTLGRCKCGVGFLDKDTNFCGNCGQKLDWSGEDGRN